MSVIDTIKIPVAGTITTVANIWISLDSATRIVQFIGASCAVFVGVLTIILTIKKIKHVNRLNKMCKIYPGLICNDCGRCLLDEK